MYLYLYPNTNQGFLKQIPTPFREILDHVGRTCNALSSPQGYSVGRCGDKKRAEAILQKMLLPSLCLKKVVHYFQFTQTLRAILYQTLLRSSVRYRG